MGCLPRGPSGTGVGDTNKCPTHTVLWPELRLRSPECYSYEANC